MLTVDSLCCFLDQFAPTALAESWDNVGLLVGDRDGPLARVMACLTITPDSAAEAIADGAQLIVSHHPLPFRELKRLTRESVEGALLLDLIAAGIAIYSPHTAFDSAAQGINRRLADGLGLIEVKPLLPCDDPAAANNEAVGTGRWGRLPA
ncbi:MAG: Nif3-like dinuclear metal center hexameric protein, partial [Planctomycetes bacterium]|nr:Nif3-like dinuclear metal center hexameric protein [Planctomycetota bacterium]